VFTMTIGERAAGGPDGFEVLNPATGQVVGTAPDCTREELDEAMAAAATAWRSWRAEEPARRQALLAAADAIEKASEEIGAVLTAEQGKPLRDSAVELGMVQAWLRYYAELELPREVIQDDESAFVEVVRRPIGPVAAITPWNFPLLLATWKIAPALRAGNTVVLKPSHYTPLSTLRIGEVLRAVLPPGVLNVVSGLHGLGTWMCEHPVPRKISFTGSIGTGKRVAAAAASDLKRVTLELGGNDPAIVLDDVDPKKVAGRIFWGAFVNNGQTCSAIKRVYVAESIYGDVVEALADRARSARVGNGAEEGVQLGPLNNREQLDRVTELLTDALDHGAEAVTGGARPDGPGWFFEPTIVAGATDGTALVDDEQFGPVLPVLSYRSVDEAIERANASHFGLSGSVWSADSDRAAEVAAELECGTAWVNTHVALAPFQPFGGVKWSGIGVENGPWGLYGFTDLQAIHRSRR
jgi:acyl-CoA reductase-like NAD-dependent aldehyde dehydrogenase